MQDLDIRWKQRFNNFTKALKQLETSVKKKRLNKLEEQGLIKAFEYTYELSWNTIKDFYQNQGEVNLQGSKDSIRLAFQRGLIENGEKWLQMLTDRNKTIHTYNELFAKEVISAIINSYFTLFKALHKKLKTYLDN